MQGGEKEGVSSSNADEFSRFFPKLCALRNWEGKGHVEEGEDMVSKVMNGKMEKHNQKLPSSSSFWE